MSLVFLYAISLTSEEQKATFSYIFPFAKLRILVTPNHRRIL